MEQTLNNERINSMEQEIIKQTLDSEGNQTHYGRAVTTVDGRNRVIYNTMTTGVAALDEEDYFTSNSITVQGTNKDGDLRIRAHQNLVITEDEWDHGFSTTQSLVITREDAKSLIKALTSYL
jgi:hypothetical protein